jgi:predicted NBD/HSP70 family sugar kinase
MKNESRLVVGVDIGGTKVAAGLVNAAGEILARSETPMLATGTPSNGLAAVSTAINGLFPDVPAQNQVAAIGICARDRYIRKVASPSIQTRSTLPWCSLVMARTPESLVRQRAENEKECNHEKHQHGFSSRADR